MSAVPTISVEVPTVKPAVMKQGPFASVLLFVLPVTFASCVYFTAIKLWQENATPVSPTAPYYSATYVKSDSKPHDGESLYLNNCAYCHGARGDGQGVAALAVKARYFGFEKYKFASTANAIPTDEDLKAILKRGIPGSAMPAFAHLNDRDLNTIMDHVRYLTKRGMTERFAKKTLDDGDDPDYANIGRRVEESVAVVEPVKIPAEIVKPNAGSIENGHKIFLTTGGCAACHGKSGKGDGEQAASLMNEDKKTPNRPRDLTLGLFKGGDEPEALYKRIVLGIPGTPMPAAPNTLKPQDIADLIQYVRSLSVPTKPETVANRQ